MSHSAAWVRRYPDVRGWPRSLVRLLYAMMLRACGMMDDHPGMPGTVTHIRLRAIFMSEPFGFQLSGSAPDMYERYIVATLTATLAQTS